MNNVNPNQVQNPGLPQNNSSAPSLIYNHIKALLFSVAGGFVAGCVSWLVIVRSSILTSLPWLLMNILNLAILLLLAILLIVALKRLIGASNISFKLLYYFLALLSYIVTAWLFLVPAAIMLQLFSPGSKGL